MKRSNKLLFSILFMVMTVFALSAVISVNAEEYSGMCGDDLTWSLDTSTGVLEISGTGDMYNYTSERVGVSNRTSAPWGTYVSGVKSVVIDDGVTCIGDYAFFKCNVMTNILIGEDVKSIGKYAFQDCVRLTEITIPDSVTYIGNYSFNYCKQITEISLGNSIESIGDYSFYYCSKITSIALPESVKSIGAFSFSYCTGLTSFTVQGNVTDIGTDALSETPFIKDTANWEGELLYIGKYLIKAKDTLSGSYTIKPGTKCIADGAFYNCVNLTYVTIPEGITTISDRLFSNCKNLKALTLPNGITSIGSSAFHSCSNLEISIPPTVTSIGDGVFHSCYKLVSINIPEGVTNIGNRLFYNCDNLKSVELPSTITSIDDYAFYSCQVLSEVKIPDGVTKIGNFAFGYCNHLANITLPDSITSLGDDVFRECRALNSITLPANITTISKRMFCCSGIRSISLDGITIIEEAAFMNSSLTNINIPGNVKEIGREAFYGCRFKEVTLCEGVMTINSEAFRSCSYLTSITIPPSVTSIADEVFYNSKNVIIKCFKDSYAYEYAINNGISYELIPCLHDYVTIVFHEATCTSDAYTEKVCKKCGEKANVVEKGSALGHKFTSYKSNNDATCTKDGTKTALCDNGCGKKETVVAAGTALGHKFTGYRYNNDATCTENATKTSVCDNGCGIRKTVVIEGTALGHSFTDYVYDNNESCTENGTETAHCDNGCGLSDTRIVEGSALGHSFTNYINDNNTDCTHDGTETAHCDNGCGLSDTRIVEGSALGHSFTNYINDNNTDCTHDGTETAHCDNGCGFSDTRIVEGSAFGHSFTYYTVISELSCTVNGEKEAYCDNGCGEKDVIIEEAQGHIPGEWIVTEEPDYYNEGNRIKTCTVCSEMLKTEIMPILIYEGFPDVWDASWYAEGIEYCFKHGYILGTDDGTFKPNAEMTREQFVVILARISGEDISEYTESVFDDVEDGSWYAASVNWASEKGYVNGIGNGNFGVGQAMSREALAVILYRYAEKQGIDVSEKADLRYCDDAKDISEWAVDACAWAINEGLLGSTSESANLLAPKTAVTRAQAAKIFMSYDNII